jgi:hypothetical protein
LVTTAPMPAVGSPNPMLRLPFTWVQLIGPAAFCAWPSMMTLLPTAAGELLLALVPVLDLLLEQPARPAATVAAAAMPTKIPCFATALLCLVTTVDGCALEEIDAVSSGMHRQRLRSVRDTTRLTAADAVACARSFETQRGSAAETQMSTRRSQRIELQ